MTTISYPTIAPYSTILPPAYDPADRQAITRLCLSILDVGLRRPLVVIAHMDGDGYSIIDGKRRYHAINRLIRSGQGGWSCDSCLPIRIATVEPEPSQSGGAS